MSIRSFGVGKGRLAARTAAAVAGRSSTLAPSSLLREVGRVPLRALSTQGRKEDVEREDAYLVLSDGTFYKGRSFGARTSVAGELVFNTGMVGYPESMTDPSYRGQILTCTYPLIGNYGVPNPAIKDELGLAKYFESEHIQARPNLIHACKASNVHRLKEEEVSSTYSHWNAHQSLQEWLRGEGIPAIEGIDTRAVTKKIRSEGAVPAKIIFEKDIPLLNIYERNLVAEVSVKEPKVYGNGPLKIIAVDCGMKHNIIRSLVSKGTTVKVVPWNYDYTKELKEEYHGLFISNGPGDPSKLTVTIDNLRHAMDIGKPIFGICLGNQLLAHAAGGKTYKLPFGNRGQNQPVIDQITDLAYITPQNHGFAVDTTTLPHNWKPYFTNGTDGSNEGILCTNKPFYSVQFHPEAKGGPYDTAFLFDKFLSQVKEFSETNTVSSVNMRAAHPIKKVVVLGSGGLQIGQAGEFDYSGSQAIKAFKEEGVRTVLINPNIATVQTAKGLADSVYFLPVTPYFVEQVLKKESPDGIALSFGGQTALNCGVKLYESGTLKKYGVQVLGTPVKSIIDTEDRQLFADRLAEIDIPSAPSVACDTLGEAHAAATKIGFPVIVRAAYSLGGLGSGFANNSAELENIVVKALGSSPQVLVEKSMKGWKEVEYEVVRDNKGNAITVCNMENFDPMGIHTGESIVVAPSQTLSNEEYHKLRSAAIKTVSHLGIIGECNIQYSLDPFSEDYAVIEVNARLSRSSALASKATGYPLAYIAAKLALGAELPDLKNNVTKETTACFEPSLDYLVVKMPRWDLGKFSRVDWRIGSSMKSVGEVMSIGRSFEEGLQKAIRMVDVGNKGFEAKKWATISDEALHKELTEPTSQRIFALSAALRRGFTVEQLYNLTKIDRWYLDKLFRIHSTEQAVRSFKKDTLPLTLLQDAKGQGFSDIQLAEFLGCTHQEVRQLRKDRQVLPCVKQIDTLAAEFPAKTNYLYTTYNGTYSDSSEDGGAVMVLGSGVYRIGSSVEFDYGAVECIRELRRLGKKTIMVNYNPETVSTDYDESDKLYFEELSLERILDIYDREKPAGVVVSVGGQQPQNIALALHKAGVKVLGTSPLSIDAAEDRSKFSALLDKIKVKQPEWNQLSSFKEAKAFAHKVGYPCLVRPSYVLSGAAMKIVNNDEQMEEFLAAAVDVSPDYPVVISKFILGAREVECDAVANKGTLVNWAISEHIEDAGVHSGDATTILPAISIPDNIQAQIKSISEKITKELQVSGPVNVQYLVKGDEVLVIECNLRASRSFPFVSKVLGIDFLRTATRIFMGEDVPVDQKCYGKVPHYGVKAPMFSFQRLLGADPILGVEMASTGEVACFGKTPEEAFLKAVLSSNFKWPERKTALVSNITPEFARQAKDLHHAGYRFFATPESSDMLAHEGIPATTVPLDGEDSAMSHIQNKSVDFVVTFPNHTDDEYYPLRRKTVDFGVPIVTDPKVAGMVARSLSQIHDLAGLTPDHHDSYLRNTL